MRSPGTSCGLVPFTDIIECHIVNAHRNEKNVCIENFISTWENTSCSKLYDVNDLYNLLPEFIWIYKFKETLKSRNYGNWELEKSYMGFNKNFERQLLNADMTFWWSSANLKLRTWDCINISIYSIITTLKHSNSNLAHSGTVSLLTLLNLFKTSSRLFVAILH